MTRLAFCLALPLALAGCSDTAAPEDPDVQDPAALDEDGQQEETAVPADLDLSGTWAMTSFNGSENFTNYPITATFDGDLMTLSSRCIRLVYSLSRTGNVIAPEQQSQDICPAGLAPAEQNLVDGLPEINIVMVREEGSQLVMSGPGGNIRMTREGAGAAPAADPAADPAAAPDASGE